MRSTFDDVLQAISDGPDTAELSRDSLRSFLKTYGTQISPYDIPCVDIVLSLIYERMFIPHTHAHPDDKHKYAAIIDALWAHKRTLIQSYRETDSRPMNESVLESFIRNYPLTELSSQYLGFISRYRSMIKRTTALYQLEQNVIFAKPRIFEDLNTHMFLLRHLMEHRISLSLDLTTIEQPANKDIALQAYSKKISNIVYAVPSLDVLQSSTHIPAGADSTDLGRSDTTINSWMTLFENIPMYKSINARSILEESHEHSHEPQRAFINRGSSCQLILTGMAIGAAVAIALIGVAIALHYTPSTSHLMISQWFGEHVINCGNFWVQSVIGSISLIATGVTMGAVTGGVANLACHHYQGNRQVSGSDKESQGSNPSLNLRLIDVKP